MNKTLKKLLLAFFIFMFAFATISYAEDENNLNLQIIEKSSNYRKWEDLPEEERRNTIEPLYFNLNLERSIKRSSYNQLLKVNASSGIGEKYDLRDELENNIKVKNQQKTGSCWAFSYTSALETTLAKSNANNVEFSPMHVDYKTSEMFNRKVGEGGNALLGLAYTTSGYGPIYEEDLPFDSVYDESKNSEMTYYLSDIKDVDLDKVTKARVNDATIFPSIYKVHSDNKVTYMPDTSSGTQYTDEEVNVIRNSIKDHIVNHGAISAVAFMRMARTETGEIKDLDGYYDSINHSFYCGNSSASPNHAITIVGWDDTYSKENFTNKPIHDGAYIVLNSYGTEFGEDGYCYVSYDDALIEQLLIGIDSMELYDENISNVPYDNIYQYDELGMSTAMSSTSDNIYVANVFNRGNAKTIEYLSEVGIYLMETEGIEIYVVSADNGLPNSSEIGSPVATYSGENALDSGYHVVKLSSPVKLTGKKFAIIVKYIKQGGASIPIECNLYSSGLANVSNFWDNATSNAGESYIYTDQWVDIYNCKITPTITLVNTNFCIKAFTNNSDEEYIAVDGVKLNEEAHTINVGEDFNLVATITPENATNKDVIWTSSDETIATISGTGIIKALKAGTTTITVKTQDGGFTDTCTITVNAKQNDPSGGGSGGGTGGGSGGTPSGSGNSGSKKDPTTAHGSLPYTGGTVITIAVVIVLAIGIVLYKKYKKLDDIK